MAQLGERLESGLAGGITAVRFGCGGVLVSSWDCSVRALSAGGGAAAATFAHHAAPVLDCCYAGEGHAASGGVDCVVYRFDCSQQGGAAAAAELGRHDKAVKSVAYSAETGAVVSGGWDGLVKLWDPRAEGAAATCELPDKVYSMDVSGTKLVVATANRHVCVYDVRKLEEPEQRRTSSLAYQTRQVRCFPSGDGYALSSVEGRVAMEYLDPAPEAQAKAFAFKCHRAEEGAEEAGAAATTVVHPVNALAFRPASASLSFATGGSDSVVSVWDGASRKRVSSFGGYPASISALDFSADGTMLAIAASYCFEEGEGGEPQGGAAGEGAVFVRAVV